MGLLDDAIREHLELKRRSGAEPGEIARVEREALEIPDADASAVFDAYAVFDAHNDGVEQDYVLTDETYATEHSHPSALLDEAPALDSSPAALDEVGGLDVSTVGQETVELDMQAVLDDGAEVLEASDVLVGRPVAGPVENAEPNPYRQAPLEWDSQRWSEGSTDTGGTADHGEPSADLDRERFSFE